MTPQEHYRKAQDLLVDAERLLELGVHDGATAVAHIAQGHALLAQIGTPLSWTRSAARRLDGSGRPL